MNKIVICSGGFDPLHQGHIEYFKSAKKLGDTLVVALNSDSWLSRKKGKSFMSWNDRASIIKELKCVDYIIDFNDDDDSARDAIKKVFEIFPNSHILFANGGDRSETNILEVTEDNVEFIFEVGGSKKLNSSSQILKDWESWILSNKNSKVNRVWGWYEVLDTISEHIKIKKLVVNPHKSLSYQRHAHRNEFWIVQEGSADILVRGKHMTLSENDFIIINKNDWHQIRNLTDRDLIVFEVQFGTFCREEDIERI